MLSRRFSFFAGLTFAAVSAAGVLPASDAAAQRSTDDPGTFPTPAVASDAWQLELQHDTPETIAVTDVFGNTAWYWYLPYTVINDTGSDQNFIPEVTIVTDTGNIIEAGRGVPARVYNTIAQQLHNPLLESPQAVIGNLRQGEDFAKQSVAIWPVPPEDVDQFTLFFAGLSGESAVLLKPSTGEPLMEQAIDPITGEPKVDDQGNPVMRPLIARRTLALTYATPGTPASPQQISITLLDEGQVMR